MSPAGPAPALERGPVDASAVATLIYDAECAMCRASALWLMRRALSSGRLEILPCRSAVRRQRFPQVSEEACLTAMQLVLPDGRVRTGADAVPELLRRIRPVSRRLYAWIARNRMRISCAWPPR